jgi:hypothetical protein
MTTLLCYQQLRAPNDTNGNPRRLWVVYHQDGTVAEVVDEGYGNRPKYLSTLPDLGSIDIAGKEYRAFISLGKARHILKQAV